MTNENISGFLNSIAEAKRAFDAEPDYQRQIRELESEKHRLGETVASRELRIHSLEQDNDTLLGKLRSVEAERDDAGFLALEETDKVSSLLILVHGVIGDALKAVSAVEGVERTVIAQSVLTATHDELAKVRKDNDNLIFELARKDEELEHLQTDLRYAQEQLQPFAGASSSSKAEGMDPSSPKSVTQVPDYIKEPFWGDMNIAEPGQRVTDPTASTPSSPPFPSLNVSSNNAKSEANVHTITAGGGSETVPTVSASAPIPQGLGNESVKDPTTAPTPSSAAPQEDYNALSVGNGLTEGQSEGPFAAPATTQSETVSSGTATSTTAAPSSASPPERNRDRSTFFTGRKYFDVTYFVPLHKWLNEGGSKEDYYWRPAQANVPLPEANRASHNS